MLLALLPLPFVGLTIWPGECAQAVFQIIFIFSVILHSFILIPLVDTLTMHLVGLPLPLVRPPVWPFVHSEPIQHVFLEAAFIDRTVIENEFPFAVFHPVEILALVATSSRALFDALPTLLIILPAA